MFYVLFCVRERENVCWGREGSRNQRAILRCKKNLRVVIKIVKKRSSRRQSKQKHVSVYSYFVHCTYELALSRENKMEIVIKRRRYVKRRRRSSIFNFPFPSAISSLNKVIQVSIAGLEFESEREFFVRT